MQEKVKKMLTSLNPYKKCKLNKMTRQGQFKKTERQWPVATGLEKVSFHSNP